MAGDRGRQLDALVVLVIGAVLERAGEREVKLAPLAGKQVVVQRLAQQRVAEAQAGRLARHQHLLGDRLAQRHVQRFGLDPAHLGDHRLVERAAGGDHAGRRLRVGRQPLDPQHERVAQALRGRSPSVESGREQLLAVQRIALAALEQPLHELLARRLAEDVREHLGELLAVERLELDPARAVQPVELREQRPERMAPMELVGPVAEQQHHPLAAQAAREEVDERARRAVGPVQVLEHEDHRSLLAQDVQQLEQRLEQPHLRGWVVARPMPRPPRRAREATRPAGRGSRVRARRAPDGEPGPAAAARR